MQNNLRQNENGQIDLSRFVFAQENTYSRALEEIRQGKKQSHWIWFIFPQIQGLGYSTTAQYYAINNLEEPRHDLGHPVLGSRLRERGNYPDPSAPSNRKGDHL